MAMKSCDAVLFVGRFNHITNGHCIVINKALEMGDRTLLLFGSAQESGTLRNPFDVKTRMDMVQEIYEEDILRGRLIIAPLTDMSHESDIPEDGAWGRYVLEHAVRYLHKIPELMIYGNDDSRSKWFDLNDIKHIDEYIISRQRNPISATKIRELLLYDKRAEWNENVHPRIHKHYGRLREELLAARPYREAFEKIMKGVTTDVIL